MTVTRALWWRGRYVGELRWRNEACQVRPVGSEVWTVHPNEREAYEHVLSYLGWWEETEWAEWVARLP